MASGIYSILNTANGKRYVGSSTNINVRWRVHKLSLMKNKHYNKHLQNAWNEFGETVFEWSVIEVCDFQMFVVREQAWVDYYHTSINEFGYNIVPVAGTGRGWNHTKEACMKIARAATGRHHTLETRLRLSKVKTGTHIQGHPCSESQKKRIGDANRGHVHSEEVRNKISATLTGHKRSEETRTRMSEANRRRPKISEATRLKMRMSKLGTHPNRRASSFSKEQVPK